MGPQRKTEESKTETKEEIKERKSQIERKHTDICGCSECFWEEAQKLGKPDEKKLNKLINTFTSSRSSKRIKDIEEHSKECCCVIHLREKMKRSEEKSKAVQNIITKYNESKKNKKEENPKPAK